MAAPVRIEDMAFSDLRFEVLATLCQLADADHARGKMAVLWRQCTARGVYVLPESIVTAVLGERGAAALAESGLGEAVSGGIRMRGTRGRIEWLKKLRKNAQKGGRAKAAKRQTDGTHPPASAPPPAFPPTLTPTPILPPTPAPAPVPESGDSAPPRAARAPREPSGPHQQATAEFHAYYQRTHGGAEPTWNGKTGKLMAGLVKQHGLHEIVRRINILERHPPSFPPAPWDFPTFAQHFDRIAAAKLTPLEAQMQRVRDLEAEEARAAR